MPASVPTSDENTAALAAISARIDTLDSKVTALTSRVTALEGGTGNPPTNPPGTISATATVLSSSQVRVDWTTTRTDVATWRVGRNGQDAGGTGPWSTGQLAAATRTFTFSSLLAGTAYSFSVTPRTAAGADGTPVTVTATTSGTGTPPVDPGTGNTGSAATNFNWGAPIGGDEFDGDLSKWSRYDGPGHNGNGRRVPSAFTIENGCMVITGRQNGDTGGAAYVGPNRSAKLYRDEIRARVFATGAGSGEQYHFVGIRWPDSDQWPQGGEDDFVEGDVGDAGVSHYIHHPNQGSGSAQSSGSKNLDITKWNTYSCERSSSGIKVFVNGEVVGNYSLSQTNGQVPGPMHGTLQLDNFGGSSHKEARFEIEYYRIYAPPA